MHALKTEEGRSHRAHHRWERCTPVVCMYGLCFGCGDGRPAECIFWVLDESYVAFSTQKLNPICTIRYAYFCDSCINSERLSRPGPERPVSRCKAVLQVRLYMHICVLRGAIGVVQFCAWCIHPRRPLTRLSSQLTAQLARRWRGAALTSRQSVHHWSLDSVARNIAVSVC